MRNLLLILTILLISPVKVYPQNDSSPIVVGEKMVVNSNILSYHPEIYVGLPANYNDTTSYPVVVLLDAEWLFPAFAGITKLMGQMEEIPACIVVGIPLSDTFKDYGMEFAPKITGVPQSGHADKILEYFSKELFPMIAAKYHGTGAKIIWAHSAPGGLFCTYLLLGKDRQFSGIISSSPNLRGNQEYINAEKPFDELSKKDTTFYYLSFGTDENEMFMQGMFRQVQEFKEKLENGAPKNLKWIYRDNEHKNHFTNAIVSYVDGLKLYFEMM
jgi:predicted alpha/beta superfamily hydrolase